MKMTNLPLARRIALFAALLLFCSSLRAQGNPMAVPETGPPYIARTANAMVLAFKLEAGEAQKLLPKNIKAKSDEKGLASGGLEIYATDQVLGMPNYSFAFMTLEVVSEAGSYGKEGNWAVWGAIDSEAALQTFQTVYNYPFYHEKNIRIEREGEEFMASIGTKRNDGLQLRLAKRADRPVAAEGVALMFSKSQSGGLMATEIPWLAKGNQANIVSFKVHAAGDDQALKILQKAKPFYGQISSNVFSYTRPLIE